MVGTDALYGFAADDRIAFVNVDTTHSPLSIARLDRFVSINSAIEIHLLGQVNSETIGARAVSGIGGAGDFIRGANIAPGGLAIVALPSVTPKGNPAS